ncbi:hypothetical protein GLAREA_01262 [Glarea lozoyensis ATCC 20868]|uniref:Uncharacterized protein n=1 Tax=Glarea lozoyensis (strain ATCC 20868 / MF5171) TaxID=1116229 RepID=S3CHM8_GLAL2|nr:uncharacterized protein GLAREA_01262 [Glarea lozoyensis ATCC 20868]EPE25350.1 hypothetical protein GLAREA_01262 [Glarea lozoyensis ATCC 20868]
MAVPQPQPPKLFATDIAQYSDLELDQYLETNGRCIQVEDPENLPDHFIQRLSTRIDGSATIDLNHVSARLEELATGRESSPRAPSAESTADLDDEEYERVIQARETEYYEELLSLGGRPSHPIGLEYDVAKSLPEYHEILSFWQRNPDGPDAWKGVFSCQLGSWKSFREYQRLHREQGRFPAHCARLRDRLKSHGFDRSIQLIEDLDQQNNLATWFEYLNFEYTKYDHSTSLIRRRQSRYDKAWKNVVDLKVLRPMETEESIWIFGMGAQMKGEEVEAEETVELAKLTVRAAEKQLHNAESGRLPKQNLSQRKKKLSAAKTKLNAATDSLEHITKRRNIIVDFHRQTKTFVIAKEEVARQSLLLRWMLQQVPLIERESNLTEVASTDSAVDNPGNQRKLKRDRADDDNEKPSSKRTRRDSETNTPPDGKTMASPIQETNIFPQSRQTRQTRKTRSKPSNTSLELSYVRGSRAPRPSKPSNKIMDSVKPRAVLDNGARVKKGKRTSKPSLGPTPDSRGLRRSSRLRRPPERFQ